MNLVMSIVNHVKMRKEIRGNDLINVWPHMCVGHASGGINALPAHCE